MAFSIWMADLASLDADCPRSPVFVEIKHTEQEAKEVVKTIQNDNTTAWIEPV